MSRELALDKVKKLLALSTSSNVHEAEVAAAAAQRLMLEFKIAASDVTVDVDDDDVVVDSEMYADLGLKVPPRWHGMLMQAVARANFCTVVLTRTASPARGGLTRSTTYHLVGSEDDRATVKYLYGLLRLEVERLCEMHAQAYAYDRAERASFKVGAVQSLAQRLAATRQQFVDDTRASHNSRAVAVIDKAERALEDYMGREFPKLRRGRSITASRHTAYYQGREAGHHLPMGQPREALTEGQKRLPPPKS